MTKETYLSIHRYIRRHVWLLPLSCVLWLFSRLFFIGSRLRKSILLKHAFSPRKPVISVGSVTLGGSGKTPVILFLMKQLAQSRLGYVSRGYGRKEKKDVVAIARTLSSSESVGDEAYLIGSRYPSALLAIGASKKHMIQQMEQQPVDVIFLDDGLQRYDVVPSCEVGVVPDQLLFERDELFPFGMLREPLTRLHTVDILFVIRENFARPLDELKRAAEQFLPNTCVIVEQKLVGWKGVDGSSIDVSQESVVLLSGIARPERCVALLEREGCKVLDTRFVGDHESICDKSSIQWARRWNEKGVRVVITEKDWARHVPWNKDLSFCSIILVELFPQTDHTFYSKIFNNSIGML